MAKFLFVYRENPENVSEPSPEDIQHAMEAWGKWFQEIGSAIVDPGDGLMPEGKVLKGDSVTDGPFIEAKELVGGYSVLEADSLDAAVELAKSCPINHKGGAIEIRQLAGYSADMNVG